MKGALTFLGLLLSSTVWASDGSYEIDVFVCDICNLDSALTLAITKAPPVVCVGDITTSEQRVCSAEFKELIVANPVAQTAYKFRVQRPHPNDFGQSQQLVLNWGEQQMVNRFFEIDREIREAVWAINGELDASGYRQPTRAFDYGSNVSANTAETDCQNSAAAHVFSSRANKERLQNVLRTGLANEIGRRSWREYVTSADLSEIDAGSSMTVTAALNPLNSAASAVVNGNMKFAINEQPVLLQAVGAQSCRFFNWFCTDDDSNYVHYHVKYGGRADDRGPIDRIKLRFELDPTTSVVDGERVSVILAEGSGNFVADLRNQPPESCLAQLLQEQVDNFNQGLPSDVVDFSIGPGIGIDVGDGLGNRTLCVQTTQVRACTGRTGETQTCQIYTFRSLRQCD
ncbi:hypothetical protein ACO1PK_13265 [Alishewanella sp. d11]|uniref:hypothetical protein n=1 Tax=Alishewanella sp. d11 TaxID=3414030 RepID=UPI003BF861DD